ncbi:Uncharacterised protein [Chlamydia abortus]|nr:Uncharacterised protein [Chlamydia abortus]
MRAQQTKMAIQCKIDPVSSGRIGSMIKGKFIVSL